MAHKNNKKPHIKTEDIVELYNQGMSCRQIGNKFGIYKSSVSKRLMKVGILLRKSSSYIGDKRYWLWKGDNYLDPIVRKYNQRKLRLWSLEVRKRDNNICQDCGVTEKRMHAHHIISLRECLNSSLEIDINNGITLCPKCHKHRHKEQGI